MPDKESHKMKTLLIGAGLLLSTVSAHAGITCGLTDKSGNTLSYSFGHANAADYAEEKRVARNGNVLSKGGPLWERATSKIARTTALWNGDWSITYPWDVTTGASTLRHHDTIIATGTCVADASVESPQPPVPALAGTDSSVLFVPDPSGGMHVIAKLGDQMVNMLVDTGASGCSITQDVADALLASGQGSYGDQVIESELGDGRKVIERTFWIKMLTLSNGLGRRDILATISPSGAMNLLGLPVLNALGKMTIDEPNHRLIFEPALAADAPPAEGAQPVKSPAQPATPECREAASRWTYTANEIGKYPFSTRVRDVPQSYVGLLQVGINDGKDLLIMDCFHDPVTLRYLRAWISSSQKALGIIIRNND
jgi:hypothetical protein